VGLSQLVMVRNSAFVFIKPHAVTDKVKELVKETLEKNDISIKKEGSLEAEEIAKYKKIDKHYYAIASKATLLSPSELNVPKQSFKEKFDLEWADVLKDGKALNAMEACDKFEIDAAALDKMWAECKAKGDMVKFGGGFYCGKLEASGKGPYYVFNGFFMSMRSKFVEPGASIYYYVVEWDSKLKWEDFRSKVLGPTDPSTAPADSLRGKILKDWKSLELKSSPDTGDNGVHASASPFEALSERVNWLGYRIERDPFGKVLLKAGISAATIREWCKDPQVTYGPIKMTSSLYDALEDTDTDWCAALCKMMAGDIQPKGQGNVEAEIAKLRAQLDAYQPLEAAVLAIQAHVPPPKAKAAKAKKPEPAQEKPPMRQKQGKGQGGKSSGKGQVVGSGKSSGKGQSSGKGGGYSGKGGKSGKGGGKRSRK